MSEGGGREGDGGEDAPPPLFNPAKTTERSEERGPIRFPLYRPNLCFYISLCLPLNEPVRAPQRARLAGSRRRALDRLSRRKASLGGFVSRTNLNTLAESYNLIYAPMVVLLRLNKA